MLKVEGVQVSYGIMPVLRGVSLELGKGELVAVIGPNNAGKSTLMKAIAGLVKPRSGHISLNGEDLTGLPAQEVVSRGIALVPEGRRLFPELTVEENLKVASASKQAKAGRKEQFALIYGLFPVLKDRRRQMAGSLSGGEQQMLAIGRALMGRPQVLLLDEPSLGLGPRIIKELFQVLTQLNRQQGLTILFVEQNMSLALKVSTRGYVLLHGEVVYSGVSSELLGDENVRRAYLGLAG